LPTASITGPKNMENRRQTYRHSVTSPARVTVELLMPNQQAPQRCELIDLSVDGMRIRLDANAGPSSKLAVGDQLTARLVELGLSLIARVRYVQRQDQHIECGIHFLPAAATAANERRETTLGRFLAEEQRRLRREQREASSGQ